MFGFSATGIGGGTGSSMRGLGATTGVAVLLMFLGEEAPSFAFGFSFSSGSGTGGGGGGIGARPTLITPKLTGRDYPREVLRGWPRGGRVFVRFQVDVAGRPFNCNIDRSSGDRGVDQWTCSLVLSRLRFRPATDDRGRPTVSWFGYVQEVF
jgi:protein TonB